MRIKGMTWAAALLAPLVLLMGCSGSSIMPGIGTDGGVGSVGTDTSNPDEALVFHLAGDYFGDFIADTVLPLNTRTIQAVQETPRAANRTVRTVQIAFNSDPVADHIYTVGDTGPDGVSVTYTERPSAGSAVKTWLGTSGKLKVTTLTPDRIDATFSARLEADGPTGASGTFNLSDGVLHLKF
jgi:hypothetical protein